MFGRNCWREWHDGRQDRSAGEHDNGGGPGAVEHCEAELVSDASTDEEAENMDLLEWEDADAPALDYTNENDGASVGESDA